MQDINATINSMQCNNAPHTWARVYIMQSQKCMQIFIKYELWGSYEKRHFKAQQCHEHCVLVYRVFP
jgi:hypothetical protein